MIKLFQWWPAPCQTDPVMNHVNNIWEVIITAGWSNDDHDGKTPYFQKPGCDLIVQPVTEETWVTGRRGGDEISGDELDTEIGISFDRIQERTCTNLQPAPDCFVSHHNLDETGTLLICPFNLFFTIWCGFQVVATVWVLFSHKRCQECGNLSGGEQQGWSVTVDL